MNARRGATRREADSSEAGEHRRTGLWLRDRPRDVAVGADVGERGVTEAEQSRRGSCNELS
jgi:hypothetical protein